MDRVSLPCNSQCVLVYSWKVNNTTFITGEIVTFKTAEHGEWANLDQMHKLM